MATTLTSLLALTLALSSVTPSRAYTYLQYPGAPLATEGPDMDETSVYPIAQDLETESVDSYLERLLQHLGVYGGSLLPKATTPPPATQPPYGQQVVDDDDDDDDSPPTAPPTAQQEDDEDDDTVIIPTTAAAPGYVKAATTTTTTTTTPLVPVTPSQQTVDEDDDDDDDDDDDSVTTTVAPSTTTAAPVYVRPSTTTTTTSTTTTTTTPRPITTTTSTTTTTTTVKPTTPAPAPTTHRPVPNLCDNCTFQHGVGYKPHPSDCTLYVQCRLGDDGEAVVEAVRPCPHGLYWNQAKLTCDFQDNVPCRDDICLGYKKTKMSAASCRGFWDCTSGRAFAKCCAKGFAFNPVLGTCQYQPACMDECLEEKPHNKYECDGMRGVVGDSAKYEVLTAGGIWVRMTCAPGTIFSTYPCGCSALTTQPQQVCTPQLYLPFTTDAQDQSGQGTWVQNEGVVVKDGKAFFGGRSRLIVPRFSNAWWGATVYLHLRFKSLSGGYYDFKQALVSNGDCEAYPSLSVCAGNRGVEFYADTTDSYLPANITVPYGNSQGDGWQEVLFRLEDHQFQGYVNDQSAAVQAKGNLESRQCGLVMGSGTGCHSFEGVMDDVVLYLCRPYNK